MNNKITFLMCLLMTMVWTAGCSCPGVRPPVVAAPLWRNTFPRLPRGQWLPHPYRWRTLPFEEAEGTRLLLRSALADILRVHTGEKARQNRPSRGETSC